MCLLTRQVRAVFYDRADEGRLDEYEDSLIGSVKRALDEVAEKQEATISDICRLIWGLGEL